MANEVKQKVGAQFRFCVSGSFSPADAATDWTVGSPTNVTLTQASLASAAGRQSDKCDLGATRARRYACHAALDFTGETPTTTGRGDYYWLPSTSGTQANGNVAGNSGADGAAPDGALGSITLAELIKQSSVLYIGSLWTHDGAVVQNAFVGFLEPPTRYGQMLVVNNSGDLLENDDVENHVVITEVLDEVQ